MGGREMDRHITKMVALGRQFQIGDLYDYRSDRVLIGGQVFLKTFNLPPATQIKPDFKLKLHCSDANIKCKQMGLDAHLQASTLAGFIDKYRGASNFLNDQTIPTQATRTLICRAKSHQETLDLTSLSNQNAACLLRNGEINKHLDCDATHVVVGVVYGAEAYCALSQHLSVNDQDDRGEAEENLSKISAQMKAALEDGQDVTEFKGQFSMEDKQDLNCKVKCNVYTDLRAQSVRECNVFDAYKHCHKLIEEIQKTNRNGKLAVLLCPLKFFSITDHGRLFRDVDSELITRCCFLWSKLDSARTLADAMRSSTKGTNRAALRQFGDAVLKYQQLLKTSLKMGIAKARESDESDYHVERIVRAAEIHPLFRVSLLERWFCYKKAEVEVAGRMSSLKGITFASKIQLEKELANLFGKKYALVLSIPPLDDRTNELLSQMTDYVDSYTKLVIDDCVDQEDDKEEDTRLPWHMVQHKRKQVLGKIRELADHVEKNQHLESPVEFFITPRDSGKGYWCRYSVYETGTLLKDNLTSLPGRPTSVRVYSTAEKSIRVQWDYENWSFPCYFHIEYRLKGSSDLWTEQRTTKQNQTDITIHLKTESVIELRVAADSCVGRSEFSDVIDSESVYLGAVPTKVAAEEQSALLRGSVLHQSSEIQLKMEENHDLWNWVVKESGLLSNSSSLPPLEKVLRQFCSLLEPLGKQIDQLYKTDIAEEALKNIKFISDLLVDVKDWLTLRRKEVEKISFLLNGAKLEAFDLVEIEAREPSTYEKHAKIFILKVDYVQDSLMKRICEFSHSETTLKNPNFPVFPSVSYEKKRLEFIAKTLYTFAAIGSIASRLSSDKKDTTYQIGLAPTCSSLTDGTITTIDYPEMLEDAKPATKTLQRSQSVHTIRSSSSSIAGRRIVQTHLLSVKQSLKDIRPELETCFVDIENLELFRRTICKIGKNCAVEKSEMRLVKVDCTDECVSYNCRRCEKTCKEPINIDFVNLCESNEREKLCTVCECPEVEHVFQQFEWCYKAVKVTTTLMEMKKEFETSHHPMTTEELLASCAEEIGKMKSKVLNLLDQVCTRSPEWACSVDYLVKLLKSQVFLEREPDYLVRLVTLSNLGLSEQRKTEKIRSGSRGSKISLVKSYSSVDERLPGAFTKFRSD